jgi:mannose-1-phosphate guanylyltransferase/mannose-6-phosphate isomerase
MAMQKLHPVILSGGSGTRLWPLSREDHPKQFLPLLGNRSLLQATALRVTAPARFHPPLVIANQEHRFAIREQLAAAGVDPAAILLEPVARNTGPAVAAAAHWLAERDAEACLLVLPSDHVIGDEAAFLAAVDRARALAAKGKLVTFGIRPDRPETGYGYIRRGPAIAGQPDCYEVERFVEKPDEARARSFLAEGGYDWNSGMFVFPAGRFLAELERLDPAMLAACRAAVAGATSDLGFVRLEVAEFAGAPGRSVDHAVMEHARQVAVVACDPGWSDVGAWSALWEVSDKDAAGNAVSGDALVLDSRDTLVRAEHRLVVALGLKDLVVVETPDAVLVAPRGQAQAVKQVVDSLKAQGRSEATRHRRVYRPWGTYDSIDAGERFQVKQIVVKPGGQLSLQMHYHRAEHWIVVQGTARVTRGEEVLMLHENQSTYIPPGTRHRLENPGKIELKLIEVQSGSYLGEDDIVRFADDYGRADTVPAPATQRRRQGTTAASTSSRKRR